MILQYATRGAAAAARIRKQMQRTGKNPWGQWLWTGQEDKILRASYPDYKVARKALRRRTHQALLHRARILGVAKKYQIWTGAEISRLRKLYPDASRKDILTALPGLRWEQIVARAQHAGFRRNRKRFKPTGDLLLDRILERAWDLRLTMVDLDDLARTKKYFQSGNWRSSRTPNRARVLRAVEALGGAMEIRWAA
jgi:hypothetical protein